MPARSVLDLARQAATKLGPGWEAQGRASRSAARLEATSGIGIELHADDALTSLQAATSYPRSALTLGYRDSYRSVSVPLEIDALLEAIRGTLLPHISEWRPILEDAGASMRREIAELAEQVRAAAGSSAKTKLGYMRADITWDGGQAAVGYTLRREVALTALSLKNPEPAAALQYLKLLSNPAAE